MSQVFAAIDLGSNAIKMKIIQMIHQSPNCLEDFSVDKNIGEEVYLTQSISLKTIGEIIEVFDYFKELMHAYAVTKYRAVATSAFREAKNALNVVEIIRMHTDIEVEIIDDAIEKFLTYKSIRDKMPNYQAIRSGSIVIEVNSGGSDVSLYAQNHLIKNNELNLGMKALKYKLMAYEKETAAYPSLLKTYIESQIEHILTSIGKRRIQSFIAIGGDIKRIKAIFLDSKDTLSKDSFRGLIEKVYLTSPDLRHALEETKINWYEFVAHMVLLDVFLCAIDVQNILLPDISLREGLLAELIEETYDLKRYKVFNEDPVSLAKALSARYQCNKKHVKAVHDGCLKLFDALETQYAFEMRDRLLLQISAYLHEIGKFTRMKDYHYATFDLVKNLNLFGVSNHERQLVAHVCRLISANEYKTLEEVSAGDRGRVFKLSAILSLADALDKGKKQSIRIDRLLMTENAVIIHLIKEEHCLLEMMALKKAMDLFEHAFGIQIVIKE